MPMLIMLINLVCHDVLLKYLSDVHLSAFVRLSSVHASMHEDGES